MRRLYPVCRYLQQSRASDGRVHSTRLLPTSSSLRCISSLHANSTSGGDIRSLSHVADVDNSGKHVTLKYADSVRSTYHASWLWSNDPKRVTLPSGQRMCTPGQWQSVYGKPTIKNASIIYFNVGSTEDASMSPNVQVPGPTPEECCHPLSIYGTYPSWISATSGDKHPRPYLQIDWTVPMKKDTADESSLFDLEWLERFRYDDNARKKRKDKTEIQPNHAIRGSGPPLRYAEKSAVDTPSKHGKDGLVHMNYNSLIDVNGQVKEEGLLDLLDVLFKDGAAIVDETPQPKEMDSSNEDNFPVANIAKAMSGGSLSHGALYDNIFHVRVGEANAKNVAYTSVALSPHQDLVYYESPPGIQLLHCVANGKDVLGGESTLIDGMAAAYRLREMRPESFEYLVKCPATFVKQRDGACMTYRRPHIVLAEEGHTVHKSENLFDKEIVAVHWSPPFEGPVVLPPDDVDRYYEAYNDFENLIDNSLCSNGDSSDDLHHYANEYTWEKKLLPGEMLVFNNRR
eukprot:scaffold152030_cov56-Cyclotella_meneghiniana.AAC.2